MRTFTQIEKQLSRVSDGHVHLFNHESIVPISHTKTIVGFEDIEFRSLDQYTNGQTLEHYDNYIANNNLDGIILSATGIDTKTIIDTHKKYPDIIRGFGELKCYAETKHGIKLPYNNLDWVEKARQFGELIGLCFQIKDDIFDYYDNNIGKPTGNDMKEGKLTLPVLYALNHTADEEAKSIALRVKRGEATPDEMAFLVEFAKTHGGITYAEEQMMALHQQAHSFLDAYPDSPIKTALQTYLDVVVNRTK